MKSKCLFARPFTWKKGITIFLLLVLLGAAAYAGRLAYVIWGNPSAAFQAPTVANRPAETPLPSTTPVEDEILPDGTSDVALESEPEVDPEELLLSQADLEFLKNRVNILLVGADENEMRDQTSRTDFRSDVLMLVTFDLESKTADMISIPRDTYAAQYNKQGRWKINACFGHGGGFKNDGLLYARETVSMLFGGLPIPYAIGVEMDGLKKVVDIIGGVDFDVDIPIEINGRVLATGMQRLNGQQVLDYCRARKGISADAGGKNSRVDRQQRILMAIFEQLKEKGRLTQVPEFYLALKDDVHTNLNLEQIAALAVFGLQLDSGNIRRHTLEGTYMNDVYDFSFYALNQRKKCELIKEVFGITIKPDKTYDAAFITEDWALILAERELAQAQAEAELNNTDELPEIDTEIIIPQLPWE